MPRTLVNGLVFLSAVITFLYVRPAAVIAVRTPVPGEPPTGAAAHATATAAPELPRLHVDVSFPGSSGMTHAVPAGGDLQKALDAAQPGDSIVLEAGAVFRGPFTLRNKEGEGWIVVRTAAEDSLPGPGTRVGPSLARSMPKLEAASEAVVRADAGAHHYRFVGVELRPAPGTFVYNLVELGTSATSTEDLPHHLVFDRCYLHGDPARGGRRAIAMNSAHTAVVDSHLSDFKEAGNDSQAIAAWNGPGPFRIENNYLEAAGENVLFGGADPSVSGLVPSDIEVRRNTVSRPLAWLKGDPSYDGSTWTVKNLFELKNARRVLVDGNLFEHNWAQAQSGYAILFTPRNQDGGAPWSTVEDVTFTNNVVRQAGAGINLLGRDSQPSGQTRRVVIRNNVFYELGGPHWDGPGTLFQLLEGTSDVLIEHNTASHGGNVITAEGMPHRGFVYRNNITPHNQYGIIGSGTGSGRATFEVYFPGGEFSRNVLAGAGDDAALYPSDNFFPGSLAQVGFADLVRHDYRLLDASPYKRAGTDGKDLGVDFDEFAAAPSASGHGPAAPPEPVLGTPTGALLAGLPTGGPEVFVFAAAAITCLGVPAAAWIGTRLRRRRPLPPKS